MWPWQKNISYNSYFNKGSFEIIASFVKELRLCFILTLIGELWFSHKCDYMWKHVLIPAPTWMRVIQRKCNASDICTPRLLSNSNEIAEFINVLHHFWSWESKTLTFKLLRMTNFREKVFLSCQPVNFAPFQQNLGRRADVHPILRDPNFLLCKTCKIGSSFLQNFTRPNCTCYITCDN